MIYRALARVLKLYQRSDATEICEIRIYYMKITVLYQQKWLSSSLLDKVFQSHIIDVNDRFKVGKEESFQGLVIDRVILNVD